MHSFECRYYLWEAIRNHRAIVSYLGFRSLRTFGQVYCNQGGTSRKLLAPPRADRRPLNICPIRFDMGWHPILFEKPAPAIKGTHAVTYACLCVTYACLLLCIIHSLLQICKCLILCFGIRNSRLLSLYPSKIKDERLYCAILV